MNRIPEKLSSLSFESRQKLIDYWKETYYCHGYDLVIRRNEKKLERQRITIACCHNGNPKTHVDPDNRIRSQRTKRIGCPFYINYGYRWKLQRFVANEYNLEHNCTPSPEDRSTCCQTLADLPAGALQCGQRLFMNGSSATTVKGYLDDTYKLQSISDNLIRIIRVTVNGTCNSGKTMYTH